MLDLKGKPFYLKDEDIRWVEKTLADMTVEEKVGQLFCLIQLEGNAWKEEADRVLKYQPNGTQFRPLKAEIAWTLSRYYQDNSKIPMLIPANLERGGSGIAKEGTVYADNMQVAATGDPEMARRQGLISAREALAVGGNWAFAPCIDIDYNWRNPITNTRTYGSDPDLVAKMGKAYIEAVQSMGVAACIKHFPGDGMDERDQHLVTTVNTMNCEDWDATYGKVYRECIDAGAISCNRNTPGS
jgi:beta-N-acetylhexosaminidase